jgi:hypothetical protein
MSIKSVSDVDEVLEQLKLTKTAIHIENIDITWDIINQSVITNEMLTILLAKTSCLPLVPDFTAPDVVEKLGLNNEQSTLIQNFNGQLIHIQGLLQKLIITEYVTSSIFKEMIDDEIDSLPQSDMSYLEEFIKNYQDNKSDIIQKGGQGEMYIRIILYAIFSACIVAANNNLALVEPRSKTYSTGVVSYSPEQFTEELIMQTRTTSGPLEISGVIAEYDREIGEEIQTMYGKLTQFLQIVKRKNGKEVLQEFIKDFNQRAESFTAQAENTCLQLMVKSKENDVFSQWTDIDTIEETEKKIIELNNEVEKQVSVITEDISRDVSGIAATTVSAPFDNPATTAISMASHISSLGLNMYNYLSVTNSLVKEKKQLIQQQKTVMQQAESLSLVSKDEKIEFEYKIYEFSRIYCQLGYFFKISADDNMISVYGDRVPYLQMINLVISLNDNLQLQITKLATSDKKDETETRLTISGLISLQQRLGVLKKITEMLGLFINRSAKIRIMKTNEFPDPKSIENIKSFFNQQLSELENLLVKLNATFPEREQKMQEQLELLQEDKKLKEKAIDIKLLEEDIKDIEQNERAIITQRKTDRFIRQGVTTFNVSGAILQSWSDIGLNMTQGINNNLSKYVSSLTELAGSGPLALLDGILKLLRKSLYRLFTEPSIYVILVCGLLAFEFTIGGIKGKIKMFLNAAKQTIVTIVIGPFILVYRAIKTPFGWVFRQISTLYMDRQNYKKFLKEQEEGEIYDPNQKYGGRKRKTRRNKKNKKNKTRKFRHGKKHNTRHRRRRLTKRR